MAMLMRFKLLSTVLLMGCLIACSKSPANSSPVPETSRSQKAITKHSKAIEAKLTAEGLVPGAAVFLEIIKEESILTAYVERPDGTYARFQSWPICTYSGGLGPKKQEGDGKSPEGFYSVGPAAMNPASSYHLSFNLGFPNAYDKAQGYTGSYLMVHGDCVSIGCYAMTDPVIEEIWTLMSLAFENGQTRVPVHIFPFSMTEENLERQQGHPAAPFWAQLKPAWDHFQTEQIPAEVITKNGRYSIAGVTSDQ